jgi:hypothetical protein
MATPPFLSCPAELRQQILTHCLPRQVRNAGVAPRTTALLPLLLTSKAIRLDILELLKSWDSLYHIDDPHGFSVNTLRRRRLCAGGEGEDEWLLPMRRISLRVFAKLDLKGMRNAAPTGAVDDSMFDVDAWVRCVGLLPRPGGEGEDGGGGAAVEGVVVDLTPVPVWMELWRPDWVRAAVLDARNKTFLDGGALRTRRLVGALCEHYRGTGVSVSLGGMVPAKAKRVMLELVADGDGGGAGRVGFAGQWITGPVEVPTRLSLPLLCLCWGVDVQDPRWDGWRRAERLAQIRNEVSYTFLEKGGGGAI